MAAGSSSAVLSSTAILEPLLADASSPPKPSSARSPKLYHERPRSAGAKQQQQQQPVSSTFGGGALSPIGSPYDDAKKANAKKVALSRQYSGEPFATAASGSVGRCHAALNKWYSAPSPSPYLVTSSPPTGGAS